MPKCLEMFKLTVHILLATTLRNFPFGISEIEKYKLCISDRTKFTRKSLNFNKIHKLSCEKVLPCEVYCDMTWQKFTHVRTVLSSIMEVKLPVVWMQSQVIWFHSFLYRPSDWYASTIWGFKLNFSQVRPSILDHYNLFRNRSGKHSYMWSKTQGGEFATGWNHCNSLYV